MSHIENMHKMVECLAENAKAELDRGVDHVDTKEFGEVIDMVKDLCEAEYYASIVKAMKESDEEDKLMEKLGLDDDRRYYNSHRYKNGRFAPKGYRRGFEEPMYYPMTAEMYREHKNDPEYWRDMDRHTEGRMYYTESNRSGGNMGAQSDGMYSGMGATHARGYSERSRDSREGRSGMSRRTYMESKELHKDNSPQSKEAKMKDLETYMTELQSDIMEMIKDMTPEERTLAKTKLSTLATKM